MILSEIIKNDKSYKKTILLNNCSDFAKSNPTILFNNDTLFVNFRCINYFPYISKTKKYIKNINGWISSDVVFSDNYIGYFENDVLQNNFKKCNITSNSIVKYNGLEDAIFVKWNGFVYLCGTRCDVDENIGRFCIYKLGEYYDIEEETIVRDNEFVSNIEKHWSPVEDKPFTFIKWCNPTEIVEIEPITGKIIKRTVKRKSNICNSLLRGNCQTVKYKDGYLSIVHSSIRHYNKKAEQLPIYKHYFIQYDKNFKIIRISNPFNFEAVDIEFCCGLQLNNEKVYVSYSLYDSVPVLIEFDESLLETIFTEENTFSAFANISDLYNTANEFLNKKQFYAAAACFSRIFTETCTKELEYQSLLKFCICLLSCRYKNINMFSDSIILSFIDDLTLLKNDKAEPYYLYAIYYGLTGDLYKKEIFRKLAVQYRFELPEIKRYLKMW